MHKFKYLITIFLLINTPTAFAENQKPSPIEIAVLVPLTGSAAEQGQWIRDGVLLAEEEFNRSSEFKVKAVIEDTKADPKEAIASYYNLRAKSKFPALISYGSGVGVALSAICNKDQVVQMGVATASPTYRSLDDYTFRNFPSAELDAAFVVKAFTERFKFKQIAMVSVQNEFGLASAKTFKQLYLEEGGEILAEEELQTNGSDYRSIILRLKKANVKAVYLAVYPIEGATFLKQAKELGFAAKFIASSAILGSKEFMKIAQTAAEGLIVSTPAPVFLEKQNPQIQNFVNGYRAKFNEIVEIQHIYAARAYDAFLILARGINKCSADTECLKDYLFKMTPYQGASGNVSFDAYGDVEIEFALEEVLDGKFRKLL